MKLQTNVSSLFIGQKCFIDDESQNFSIFQPILNTFTMTSGLKKTTVAWQSRVLSNEKITPPTKSNNSLSPKLK